MNNNIIILYSFMYGILYYNLYTNAVLVFLDIFPVHLESHLRTSTRSISELDQQIVGPVAHMGQCDDCDLSISSVSHYQ